MDNENQIDLKRFIPKKANKFYLLRIVVSIILLIAVGVILVCQLNKSGEMPKQIEEIRGVKIELN